MNAPRESLHLQEPTVHCGGGTCRGAVTVGGEGRSVEVRGGASRFLVTHLGRLRCRLSLDLVVTWECSTFEI